MHNFDNQIADTSNIVNNRGILNFNGKSETIASLVMNGGGTITNSIVAASTPPANTLNITGALTVTGYDDFGGVTTGFTVGNNSTVNVGGLLSIGTFGRVHLGEGATGGFLNVNGGLEMTGALINQSNGAGANTVRLSSNVTTFASPTVSRLGNSGDSDTFLELNGSRTFTVADGSAGLDLVVSSVVRDNTVPVAAGSLTKNGPGTMQLEGGGTANTYTGATLVNEGTLVLNKTAGVNSIAAGPLTIGDGVGGAKADKVILRQINQISDANDVTVASSGVLDLDTFNTSETINSLSGSGAVDIGPGSALAVSGALGTVFSGSIQGGGSLTKGGSSTLELSGSNDILGGTTINGTGKLIVSGSLGGSVTVNSGTTLAGAGNITGPVTVNAGGTVSPGNSPGILSTGSFSLVSTSTLTIELGGSTVIAGTDYDRVNVTGTVDLGAAFSTLNVSILGGFSPAFNDTFLIILNDGNDAVTGSFAGISDGDTVSFGGYDFTFDSTYDGNADLNENDVALISQIPEPSSFASLIAGLGSLVGLQRFRRRRSA